MTQNNDHDGGGAYTSGDVVTVQCVNVKEAIIQAAAPSTKYDGQSWHCTSSNPPLVQVYDLTNTQWMKHHPIYHKSASDGYKVQSRPMLDGGANVHYDSGSVNLSGSTFFYFKANGVYWGLKNQ